MLTRWCLTLLRPSNPRRQSPLRLLSKTTACSSRILNGSLDQMRGPMISEIQESIMSLRPERTSTCSSSTLEPYSERAYRKTHPSGKKDIGLYAMNFGNAFVASVAVYSSYTQVLEAMMEADQFVGPSIVLAYLPYGPDTDNPLTILQETKTAVDIGYWPLLPVEPESH